MSPRERKPFFSKDRLKEAGVRTTALIAIGAAGLGLTACGPSETKATESPAPTASAPVTPGVSESPSPSASETAPVTVENSNITSITESEQFKALSPEDQALIKQLETLDFSDKGIGITEGVTAEMEQKFAKLALEVYGPYMHEMMVQDMKKQGISSRSMEAIETALENESKGASMSSEDIELLYEYYADATYWMMTKNGDPTVLNEKRQTAINVAVALNRMALPDGDIDTIRSATSANDGGHLTFMKVSGSSQNITIGKGASYERTCRAINIGESENHVYCYRPTLGGWERMQTLVEGESTEFVPDSKLGSLTADDLIRLGA